MNQHKYIEKIKSQILAIKPELKEIDDLDFVKILDYSDQNIAEITNLILAKKFIDLKSIEKEKSSDEDLIIMRFYSSTKLEYWVTVYDNDGLWQDPKVIEIYKGN